MIKIGALSFINALPFFNPFIEKRIPFAGEFSYGTPTEINKRLESSQVDIGLVSSSTFIQNRERYVLLTNLGIGATKSMKSVCLFSNVALPNLDGKQIAIPDQSATSVALLKVLCKYYWNIAPIFIEVQEKTCDQLLASYDAALVIGDECLLAQLGSRVRIVDLTEEWHYFTNKPFVYALFATRVDAWIEWPDEVREFHQKLVSAYDYSTIHFAETVASAQKRTGLSKERLQEYFRGLDYYLDSSHFAGLEQFAALNAKSAS